MTSGKSYRFKLLDGSQVKVQTGEEMEGIGSLVQSVEPGAVGWLIRRSDTMWELIPFSSVLSMTEITKGQP